jgi:predicted  nucleic acid-binding Zn ribbon protein
MVTFELLFLGKKLAKEQKESFWEDALDLISCMKNSGQIIGDDSIFVFEEDVIRVNVLCPYKNSLDKRYNYIYANRQLLNIEENYGLRMEIKCTGNYPFEFNQHIDTASAFLLYWGGFSPIRSMDSFEPIPLYEFPYTYKDGESYNDITFWENDYEAINGLWKRGQVDENKFYQYLSSVKSPLSQEGMRICRKIGELTNKDCYYYLFNYNSTRYSKSCPCCGASWKLVEKLFDEFNLKCDRCKIISRTKIG